MLFADLSYLDEVIKRALSGQRPALSPSSVPVSSPGVTVAAVAYPLTAAGGPRR